MTAPTRTDLPVDALLFDVGGVLIDIDFKRALRHWAGSSGLDEALLAQRFSPDRDYEAHERGELASTGFFSALRGSLQVELSDAQLLAGWNAIFIGPFAGVATLLQQLGTQLPIYLFSNTNRAHYAFWGSEYPDLLAPVRQVFCSHEIGLRKPSVQAYAHVIAQIGLPAQRIAFFDDSALNVDGARQAGLQAFVTAGPDALRQALTRDLGLSLAR
ncbi:MAG: HAD-IA family hydrolase [Burkholderiaceae bacterium]|nr:HAD-IA family hydrolase [Burkholderiaceae bacterium]